MDRPVLAVGRPAVLLFAVAAALGAVALFARSPGPAGAVLPLFIVLLVGLVEVLLPLPREARATGPGDALLGDEAPQGLEHAAVAWPQGLGCRPAPPPGCRVTPGSLRRTGTGFAWDVQAERRGRDRQAPVVLERSGLLGTWRRGVLVPSAPLTVRPGVPQVRVRMDPKAMPSAGHTVLAARRGAGDEFRSLREFSTGDSTAQINWKATARMGHPIVNEHMPEEPLRVMLYLDTRGRAAEAVGTDGHERAIALAHGLARTLLAAHAHVGLVLLEPTGRMLVPGSGAAQRQRIEDLLLDAEPGGHLPLADIVAAGHGTVPGRSIAVLVASDLTDPSLPAALEALRARHRRTYLLVAAFPLPDEDTPPAIAMRAAGALLGLDQATALEAMRPWVDGVGAWHHDEPVEAAIMRAGWLQGGRA